MKIEELTKIEKSIESLMPEGGHFEERHTYLSEHGLYKDWRNLFVQYANLALDDDLEATKRALFLFGINALNLTSYLALMNSMKAWLRKCY